MVEEQKELNEFKKSFLRFLQANKENIIKYELFDGMEDELNYFKYDLTETEKPLKVENYTDLFEDNIINLTSN